MVEASPAGTIEGKSDVGGSVLAGLLLAAERGLRKQKTPAEVRHVLLLEYRLPLGCCVHLTPVFEAIKRSRPEIRIAVATRGLGAQVHRHSRYIDHLIETPDPLTDLRGTAIALRRQLQGVGFRANCVLTGASDRRTRIALLGMLASGGWRGGYTLKPALYQRPLAYDDALSQIGNNLRLAQMLGCEAVVDRPRVFFSANDVVTAEGLVREITPDGRPLVVMVTQNSGGQNTGWHTDRFVEVIRAAEERGLAVMYVGTAGDAQAIETIVQAAGGVGRSIAGQTTVTELAAVLAMSDVMVTLDTGTMHVGRAAGLPMVVLGPSWQKPLEWMPLGVENVRILRGTDRVDVPVGYRLDEIAAGSVIGALDELLTAHPPSMESRQGRLREGLSELDHRSS